MESDCIYHFPIDMESDCIYHFPIDVEPNAIPFGFKSIGKRWIQFDLSLIEQDSENISLFYRPEERT